MPPPFFIENSLQIIQSAAPIIYNYDTDMWKICNKDRLFSNQQLFMTTETELCNHESDMTGSMRDNRKYE